jgi:hypothetical protein
MNKWQHELTVFLNLDGILADLAEEVAILILFAVCHC